MFKNIKKVVAVAMVFAMAMGMTLTAAAESPTSKGVVNKVVSAVDQNNKNVAVEVQQLPEEYQSIAEDIRQVDVFSKILGNAYVEGMEVIDVRDVIIVGDRELVSFPVTITFSVPGVLSTTNVAVLHYLEAEGRWEVVDSKAGNGTITATFNSLSPVAFIVDKNTTADGTSVESKSPKTGEGMMVPFLSAAAVVLLIGSGVCLRKRETR